MLKEMNLDHSADGIKMIKDGMGFLKLQKLKKEKETHVFTMEER